MDPKREKAAAFEKNLGINQSNYDYLRNQIALKVKASDLVLKGNKGYGSTYEHVAIYEGPTEKTRPVVNGMD